MEVGIREAGLRPRARLLAAVIPASALGASRVLIDGDRFRTESPEAIYEGVFNINVEAAPHEIDVEFVAGPEAGNWNFGIFRLEGDKLELCLDVNGKPRPAGFGTSPGSGHAVRDADADIRSRARGGNGRRRLGAATTSARSRMRWI